MQPLQFFKCLADDTRLKALLLINAVGQACVCDLMQALNLDQPKTSRHLAELRKHGLLQDERRGKWVYYQLHPDLPAWAGSVIKQAASNNPAYFDDALQQLKHSLKQKDGCA